MTFALPLPPQPFVPIADGQRFPVHRIYCVGRNYREHSIEMGGDPARESPFFFQKNADSVLIDGAACPYPSHSEELHHEVELVVAIGKGGRATPVSEAMGLVFGYAVGVDMTARDRQSEAKKAGRPWTIAKSFDHSAPIGSIVPAGGVDPRHGHIWLRVNGEPRQDGDLGDMIWSVGDIVASLSTIYQLMPGDLIFTGTPAGVGPIQRGDTIHCGIDRIGDLTFNIV